jgi:hypothetical protein
MQIPMVNWKFLETKGGAWGPTQAAGREPTAGKQPTSQGQSSHHPEPSPHAPPLEWYLHG